MPRLHGTSLAAIGDDPDDADGAGRPLIAIEAARERVLERRARSGSERLALRSARGRILAEPAALPGRRPGLRQLGDGRVRDPLGRQRRREPGGPALAADRRRIEGRPPGRLEPCRRARRSRSRPGRWSPAGADAVIRIEDTEPDDGRVSIRAEVPPGNSIRRSGEDLGGRGRGRRGGDANRRCRARRAGGRRGRRAGLRAAAAGLGAADRGRARRARPGAAPGPDP